MRGARLHTRCFESNRGANKKDDRRPEPAPTYLQNTLPSLFILLTAICSDFYRFPLPGQNNTGLTCFLSGCANAGSVRSLLPIPLLKGPGLDRVQLL
jgi:hypothetical protein